MECTGVLLVLACAIYSVCSQKEVTIDVSGSQTVSVGDTNVMLQCQVKDLDIFSHVVSWYRKLPGKDDVQELTNHITVTRNIEHYSITVDHVAPITTYTLTINDITSSDDGFYMCSVSEDAAQLAASKDVEITVKQPIESLVLNVGNNEFMGTAQSSMETIEMEQFDTNLVIGCQLSGSNPAPHVKLAIGEENISTQVLRQDQERLIGDGFDAYRTYDTDLDSTGKKTFDASIIGKEISCAGWTDDENNQLKASVTLTLKEPPKVECLDAIHRVGDRRVKLSCTIESLQQPQNVEWNIESATDPMVVPANGATNKEYVANKEQIGDNTIKVTLEILQADEAHFENIYTLKADVAPEGINHIVRLQKSATTPKGPNTGESGNSAGFATFTTSVLLVIGVLGGVLRKLF